MRADTDSVSNEEWYRFHGTLTDRRINQLIDMEAKLEVDSDGISSAITYIEEARSPFSAEDFLSEAIQLAGELRANVLGANKDTADRLYAMLEDVAQTTFNAVDHSNDLLRQALDALNGM